MILRQFVHEFGSRATAALRFAQRTLGAVSQSPCSPAFAPSVRAALSS